MKLYFPIFLVVLVTLSTSSNTPKSDVQKEEELLYDTSGVQNGSNILMVNPGPLKIMLNGNELVFEVCSSLCDSNFLVCYESDPVGQNVTEQCDSKCGFYVLTSGDKISFNEALTATSAESKMEDCDQFTMVYGLFYFRQARMVSCKPKIVNGFVKLNIQNASSECPVSIKNATIVPDTTTPLPTTHLPHIKPESNGSSGNDTTTSESGGFIENYWWIFLIIAVVLLIIVVVVTVICCRRSKKEKKKAAAAALPPRKIQGSKSPIVVQSSTEDTHGLPQRQIPPSLMQPSSILSRKSLLWSKKEIKSEETDLTSMKPTA